MMLCIIWVCRCVIPVAYQVAGWANAHWFDALISGTVLLTAAILCAQLLNDYLSAKRRPPTHGDLGRECKSFTERCTGSLLSDAKSDDCTSTGGTGCIIRGEC